MDVVTRAPRLRPAEQGREHALGAAARERVDREQYPLSVQHVSSLEFDAQIRFGRTLTTPICCSAHSAARFIAPGGRLADSSGFRAARRLSPGAPLKIGRAH